MKYVRVQYKCLGCHARCSTTTHNLRHRTNNKDLHYCFKCLLKLEKLSAVFAALPAEYHSKVFAGCIDYTIAIRYLKDVSTKLLVRYECRQCHTTHCLRWSKFKDRKHFRFDDLCYKCLGVLISNDPLMVEQNSRNSKSLWLSNGYRKKCLHSFLEHSKRLQIDPLYAAKYRRKCRSIAGSIVIRGQVIRFDSAFELFYLWYIKDRCSVIRRCEFAIAYGEHFYHPDFFVIDLVGGRTIIEIKGYYRNNVIEKQTAALAYIAETAVADNYVLYDTERLIAEGIVSGRGGARMWRQIRSICDETTITFADQKHCRIAEIGPARFRAETQSKENRKTAICR